MVGGAAEGNKNIREMVCETTHAVYTRMAHVNTKVRVVTNRIIEKQRVVPKLNRIRHCLQ